MSRPTITSMRALRAAFWADHPEAVRRRVRSYSGKGLMFVTDTRVAFVDWIDSMERNGSISTDLAARATLKEGS